MQGGSAPFIANLFDLLGQGHVLSIDIGAADPLPKHDRITFMTGSSTDPAVEAAATCMAKELSQSEVLVLLDSDHHAPHVLAELQAYNHLVPKGGYVIVQDGVVDELRRFRDHAPGPLVAIEQFLAQDSHFEVDEARSGKFLFHYSPRGCLRRVW